MSRVVQVDGLKELRAMFKTIAPRESNNAMRAATYEIAGNVLDMLTARVTKDTGDLKRSLFRIRRRGRPGEHVAEVRGGATAPYMLILEFGSSKTQAQPFIVPTTEQFRPKQAQLYRQHYFEKLRKGLLRAARQRSAGAQ